MLRWTKCLFITIIMTIFCTGIVFADANQITIQLDGKEIINDSPPVILDGRTLIPARAVFEAMGGTVSWNESTKEVTVNINENIVKLKIDSKTVGVNGVNKTIDVPAMIINNRTMVPVRFISEAVGCEVSWNETNKLVAITSPSDNDIIQIRSIELSDDGKTVEVNANKEITDYQSFKMTEPSRMIFDINNATLSIDNGTIAVDNNPYFKSIRYSQYKKTTVRVVADLTDSSSGTISRSSTKRTAYMTFEVNNTQDNTPTKEEQAILDKYGLNRVESAAQHKLVVIDPGHGGSDTGSRGYENGVAVLNEKDINLDIALRIQKMLETAGADVYMIRTKDTTIPLYDRQDKANALNASLYVAVHNNSCAIDAASGTEVLYYSDDSQPKDGISSVELAKNLQKTLVENLGLVNRGAKTNPELAVLRRTTMPAVIIEGAFISNPGDLKYMLTNDFREKYAKSAAKCIIDVLNNSI